MSNVKTSKLVAYIQIMRLDKPIGTLLLLWPTMWSLWIASNGKPNTDVLIIFILGTIIMRAAGCVINDFVDRDFDGKVERTKSRPLITGSMSGVEAISLFVVLCAFAFALVLMTNALTIKLSFGALAIAMCYPFMKRHTHLPQVILGAAFSFGIPMAYAAQTGELPNEIWLIFIANLLWTVAYDTFYAMVDRRDDLKVGIKSTAVLFGDNDRLVTGLLQIMALIALIMVGTRFELGLYYFLGLVGAGLFFAYQQYLIKFRHPKDCFRAFLNNHWVGLVIFIGIAANFYLS